MPKKIGIRLGWFKRFMELPRIFSAWATASSLPTIFTRSPICNCRLGVATRSTPERFTRVMLAPKLFLIFSWANVLPFNSGLVIRIFLEISCLFWKSHSTFTCFPKNTVIASTSIGLAITRISSCMWNTVVEFTSSVCLSPSQCRMREITKSRFTNGLISFIVLPSTASLRISSEIGRTVSSCRCPNPRSASASSVFVLMRRIYFNASRERIHPTTPSG